MHHEQRDAHTAGSLIPASPASTLLLRNSLDWGDHLHSRQSTRYGTHTHEFDVERRIPRVGDSRNLEGWSTTPHDAGIESSFLVAGTTTAPRRSASASGTDGRITLFAGVAFCFLNRNFARSYNAGGWLTRFVKM